MSLSINNSTIIPLLANATFTGALYDNILDFAEILISIKCDTAYTLEYIYSQDKINVDFMITQEIPVSGTTQLYKAEVSDRYFKLQILADNVDMTVLNVQTIYKTATTYMASASGEGPTGATGPQGEQGEQGEQGDIGPTGDTGPPGSYLIGDGLDLTVDTLSTIGNPAIQLVSNARYVNDSVSTIQSQIDSATSADVIYISAGSYSENLVINNKINIAIQGPTVFPVIMEIDTLTLSGTSQTVRLANMQVQGLTTIGGAGGYVFSRCVWQGTALSRTIIDIGAGVANYITFENCEFDQYCDLTLNATFASVCYFINCNFGGSTITLSQFSNQQAIFNNCAGLITYPSNATLFGMNVLTTGESRSTSTTLDSLYMRIGGVSTSSSVNDVITTNGISGFKLTPTGGPDSYRNVFFESGQNTVKSSTTITLYEKIGQINVIPDLRTLYKFNFGLSHVGTGEITYNLYDTTGADVLIQSIIQTSAGGHHTIPLFFSQTLATVYTLNFRLDATSAGVISTDASDYYSVEVCQIKDSE